MISFSECAMNLTFSQVLMMACEGSHSLGNELVALAGMSDRLSPGEMMVHSELEYPE